MPTKTTYRDVPTTEQREQFLELIRDGEVRHIAAGKVGSTSSRFKGLLVRDQEFREAYMAALMDSGRSWEEDGGELADKERLHLARKIFDEYVERALNPEAGQNGSANRLLHNLALLLNTTFKPLLEARLHRHVHEGSVGIFAMPQIDTSRWTLEEQEEFITIEQRRNELIEIAAPGRAETMPELPPGVPGVIDSVEQPASE